MHAIVAENQYAADALHQGIGLLVEVARLVGEPIEDVDDYAARFWISILVAREAAGTA